MDRERVNREYADRRTVAARDAGRSSRTASRSGNAYEGRFGAPHDAGRKRPTGSYRSQPSGSYRSRMDYGAGEARRPVPRSGGDSYTRRPAPKAPVQPPEKPRGRPRRKGNPLMIVLAVLALLVLAGLIVLVVSSAGQTYHQMPAIERLGSVGGGGA